ncbi:MAG TPA: helix-turn-helix transcriptional regulator, partial [Streptosporangiaceae bacterium]|nr:helix-turn-helix transcriptional regulator [Streptosporangiaceae bacterium]
PRCGPPRTFTTGSRGELDRPKIRAESRKRCARSGTHSGSPGPGSRTARRSDEPGHRGRVRPNAHRPRPPAAEAGPGLGGLGARERELVTLVAQGRTNAQIAAQLFINVRTVGSHLDRIRDKTGCRRRADLTRLALTEGLV